jgi:predicted GIY-YIG superfamily endonuclease
VNLLLTISYEDVFKLCWVEIGNDHTKNKGPWKIIHSEKYPTRSEAIFRERFLKTGKGRLFIKSFTGK